MESNKRIKIGIIIIIVLLVLLAFTSTVLATTYAEGWVVNNSFDLGKINIKAGYYTGKRGATPEKVYFDINHPLINQKDRKDAVGSETEETKGLRESYQNVQYNGKEYNVITKRIFVENHGMAAYYRLYFDNMVPDPSVPGNNNNIYVRVYKYGDDPINSAIIGSSTKVDVDGNLFVDDDTLGGVPISEMKKNKRKEAIEIPECTSEINPPTQDLVIQFIYEQEENNKYPLEKRNIGFDFVVEAVQQANNEGKEY